LFISIGITKKLQSNKRVYARKLTRYQMKSFWFLNCTTLHT